MNKDGDGAYEARIENYEQKFNVWVAGQQITAKNKGDVLGDGTVRFYDKGQYVPLVVDMYYGYTNSNFKNSRVLVLDNLNMTKDAYHSDGGDKAQIYIDEDIFVVLIGKNTLYNKSAADGIYVGSSSVNFIGGGSLTADVSYNDRDGLCGREAWVFFEARTTVSLSGAHGINLVGMDTPSVSVGDDAKLYCFASQTLNDKNYPALTCAYLNVRDNAEVICETAFNGEAIDTWSNKFSNEKYDIKILKKGEYKSGTYGTVRSPYEPVLGINVSGGVYEDDCRYISIKAKAVQSTYERGDINKDGYVDNKDVVLLFRFVSGSDQTVDETLCDFNEDGTVDNKDVVALFRYVSTK